MQKKMSIFVSLLLLGAVLLSACASSSSNNNNNGAGGTPGANSTSASTSAVTPAATGALGNPTGTAAATGTVVATGTAAAAGAVTGTPAGTAAATSAVTGTPGASIPETGSGNVCQFNRLTKFDGMTVVDQNNKEIGTVKDVVVVRDTRVFQTSAGAPSAGQNGSGNNASAQGQANGKGTAKGGNNASSQGQANGTGTNKNQSGGVIMSSGQAALSMIQYVVVDLNQDNGGKTVLLPFRALSFAKAAAENKSAEAGATAAVTATANPGATAATQAATPAANATPAATGAATNTASTNNCVATLTLNPSALANIPAFDASKIDFTAANWDEPFRGYFATKGYSIPATGAGHEFGAPLLLGSHVNDVHVKDYNNNDLGTVKDFIFRPDSGQISFAALGTGGFLGIGEKIILIPLNAMNWVQADKNDATGYLATNLTKDQLQKAPTIDNLDKVDFTAANWAQSLLAYWKTLGVTVQPEVTQPASK